MSATLSGQALRPKEARSRGKAAGAAFEVEAQNGRTINNVGRDQYNNHRYELIVEPMQRRARALLRLGNTLLLSGLAAALVVSLLFGSKIGEFTDSVGPAIDAQSADPLVWPPFEVLLAIPLGAVVSFVGLMLILFSVSMRRRARREAELL